MIKYSINGGYYAPKQLSEMSGISAHTIRDRLRRGYSVEEAIKLYPTHESVIAFTHASYYLDWIGMPIDDLHKIYWKWCIRHEYTPLPKQGFSRQILAKYPMLKTVPTKKANGFYRIIRLRS